MPAKKLKVPWPPGTTTLAEGTEVQIKEATERWTDVILEDGSELRLKATVFGAVRLDGKFDPEGNPLYVLKANPVMVIANAPENLRDPAKATKVQ